MLLEEVILQKIAERAVSYVWDKIEDRVRRKLVLDPVQQAFKHALSRAFEQFEKQYPQWTAELFNVSFFQIEGAPILAQFLLREGYPNPEKLAASWADSLNIQQPERRSVLIRELELAAIDFLQYLAQALKAEPELSDLNDSRALEQLSSDLEAIRYRLGAEKATPETRGTYLQWLIERNLYIDPRGTFQTERQVQAKLEMAYVSLRAEPSESSSLVDRPQQDLKMKIESISLPPEEIEDQREQLYARFDNSSELDQPMELAEIVKLHSRLLILGEPGSGKTTLLRYLALKHAQALKDGRTEVDAGLGASRFPILIRIADYAEDGTWRKKSLSEFLADYHYMHECPSIGLADLLETELARGNCLILLDGLDEIVNIDDRRAVAQRVEEFVHRHQHYKTLNRFVITSRIAGYRSAALGEPFAHYIIQEMDDLQIQHFLGHWCLAVEASQTPGLSLALWEMNARKEVTSIMQVVQASPGVRRLATNPLLLRILVLIHRANAKLPQKRIELYKLAADTLARTWRTAQGVSESALVEDEYLSPLLSKLAYWLQANKPTGTATEHEVYRELATEWARINDLPWDENNPNPSIAGEVKKFLKTVREHTGIFVERAPKRYGFMHLTFQEYYAARYLVASTKTRARLIRAHLHDPRWDEPILLALGFIGLDSPEDASILLETAILAQGEVAKSLKFTPSPYEDILGRDYLFALRCLGDRIPANARLMRDMIQQRLASELLRQSGSARYQHYRHELLETLEYLKLSKAASMLFPLLIAALRDDDPEVHYRAVQYLGFMDRSSDEVVTALLNSLNDADRSVRIEAIESLGRLGQTTSQVVTALVNALYDNDRIIRIKATSSIVRLAQASSEVVTALLNALYDNDPLVRFYIALSLEQSKQRHREGVVALINSLHDDDRGIRYQAAASLGRLAQASSEVVTALLNALYDNDPLVRRGVVESLGRSGQVSDEAIAALLNALHDDDPLVRFQSVWSLWSLKPVSNKVVAALLNSLHDTEGWVRYQSTLALGQLGQACDEVLTALLSTLHDNDPLVRRGSTEGFELLGYTSDEVIAALLNTLHDDDPRVRFHATKSLVRLGHISGELAAALLTALNSRDPRTYHETLKILGRLESTSDEVVTALLNTLHNPNADPRMRSRVVESLGLLSQAPQEVLVDLLKALHDADQNIRYQAALSLVQSGQKPREVMFTLLEALHNAESSSVRSNSARLLGQITLDEDPTMQALPIGVLWRGLLDRDSSVRTACVEALVQLAQLSTPTFKVIAERLKQAIEDPEFDVPDSSRKKRSAHDYAFDGLWQLMISGKAAN